MLNWGLIIKASNGADLVKSIIEFDKSSTELVHSIQEYVENPTSTNLANFVFGNKRPG